MKFLLIVVVTLSGLTLGMADNLLSTAGTKKYCAVNDNAKNLKCETSKIAAFESDGFALSEKLTEYAWNHIIGSYDHLLLSVTFDTYTKDRPGFEKLYRGLSDSAWNKAIELIKYVTKRGGKIQNYWDLDIKNTTLSYIEPTETGPDAVSSPVHVKIQTHVEELSSIKEAVKIEKALSKTAFAIHNQVQSHHKKEKKDLDAGVAHFIEEEFIEDQAETIRKLVGHYNDFKTLMGGETVCSASDKNVQLACYIFDEFLRKQ